MEEQYRSSSSSASSPARRYYLPKPGAALRRPISFEDSPDWDDIHLDDAIHLATAPSASASASASINSSAYPSPSPSLPPAAAACRERKVAGATLVWKDLTVSSRSATTNRFSDRLVKSSNGYALPATLTVIMGPARSGKSTLLRAIAGLACFH
jgi:ABC-type glutathione transport system ATPase component